MSIQKFRSSLALCLGLGLSMGVSSAMAEGSKDSSGREVTAQSQAMTGANANGEAETARLIREDIVAARDLSTEAKNVRIIVVKNLITLKGAVPSEAEKTHIVRISKSIAPTHRIEDQITVTR